MVFSQLGAVKIVLVWIVAFAYLLETNVGALLTEALTADVEAVLADQTGTVSADAAVVAGSTVSPQSISKILEPVSGLHAIIFELFFSFPLPPPVTMDIPPPSFLPPKDAKCECVPRAGALAVAAGARVPNGFVRHAGQFEFFGCRRLVDAGVVGVGIDGF